MTGSSTTGSAHRPHSAGLHPIAATVRTLPDLARLLRALRRREARRRGGAELTYRELGERAGWSHTVVADYLTGKTLPPTDRFDALVQLLGAGPAEQGMLATARDRVHDHRRGRHRPVPPPSPGSPGSLGSPPSPGLPARPDPPRAPQLPPGPAKLLGRERELTEIARHARVNRRGGARVLVALTGPPGVGKSALAQHAAHRLTSRYPDGQLYADLADRHGAPIPVGTILAQLLSGLAGAPEPENADVDSLAARYRTLLHRRRMLVLLDNATEPGQVRPLLPGGDCLVLVTSRCRLNGLVAHDGARRLSVEPLAAEPARDLLGGIIGAGRVAAEPVAAAELTHRCGGLPVALHAAGARLADQPDLPIVDYLAALVDAEDPLSLLDGPDPDRPGPLRRALASACHGLPAHAALVLREVSLARTDLAQSTAAPVTGLDPATTRSALSTLVARSLLQRTPDGRYQINPIIRAYAAAPARQSALD
ncbi:AAA family ATPase [Natronosporangium hydrolyticum]|uniref:AAA family ATPase n=1 Tax=Natronosporangium hydrolyticum TaxID=2811111 RepID=A0A895YKN9_9ACTN|nr:helix-turn-helix domain-containing protein [Natronosporangium hydrolyticum]QSB15216.1 AAA family ATPase [Natronosporangium hydrolyticum]